MLLFFIHSIPPAMANVNVCSLPTESEFNTDHNQFQCNLHGIEVLLGLTQ